MLKLLRNRRAQNTMEYALIIAVVIGAFVAMQTYVKRGMQARLKAGTDILPNQVLTTHVDAADQPKVSGIFGTDTQYEPYYSAKGTYTSDATSREGTETGTITETGTVREVTGATSSRTATQQITGIDVAD